MNAIDPHATPLDIALIVASQFNVDDTRIFSLRAVAARYAKLDDTKRGLSILTQARACLDRQINQQHYHAALELPGFAADYLALGRADLAHAVIDASIQIAVKLRPRFTASMLAVTAEAAFEIGKVDQCRMLMERALEYVHCRKQFRFNYDDRFDESIPLLLRLQMVDETHTLAQKLSGFQKANAFAELAKYSRGEIREAHLEEALRIARSKQSEYPVATIAEVLGSGGEFSRARQIIAGIKQQHVRFEALVTMAVQYCEAGRHGEAVAVLEELVTADQTFFYFHSRQFARLITLLLDGHADAVRILLDRIKLEADKEKKEKDRLLRLTRFAGLVALHSPLEAEAVFDQVLGARLSEQDRRERRWGNPAAHCILFELLMLVVDRELRWDDIRRGMFQHHLEAIPLGQFQDLRERAVAASPK